MSDTLKLYSVSDRYIRYLRDDLRLDIVYCNKEGIRVHTRKYLGVVFEKNGFNYFVPLSTKRNADYYMDESGCQQIRKSIIPIVRMVTTDTYTRQPELLGTLKIGNMIPVPNDELTLYNIFTETDLDYKDLVLKEYEFIKNNSSFIRRNADILYNQKTKEHVLYTDKAKPNYLNSTVDFLYAEMKCVEFCSQYGLVDKTVKCEHIADKTASATDPQAARTEAQHSIFATLREEKMPDSYIRRVAEKQGMTRQQIDDMFKSLDAGKPVKAAPPL